MKALKWVIIVAACIHLVFLIFTVIYTLIIQEAVVSMLLPVLFFIWLPPISLYYVFRTSHFLKKMKAASSQDGKMVPTSTTLSKWAVIILSSGYLCFSAMMIVTAVVYFATEADASRTALSSILPSLVLPFFMIVLPVANIFYVAKVSPLMKPKTVIAN